MATTVRQAEIPVNPEMLAWARDVAGHSLATAAQRLKVRPEVLSAWENGDRVPAFGKLREMAELYRRTLAFFFLRDLPASKPTPPPDFRSDHPEVSPAIAREMLRSSERRSVVLELEGSPTSQLSVQTGGRAEPAIAESVREVLGVSVDEQLRARNEYQALRIWREALFAHGVLVFQMSRVPVKVCRGFSLYSSDWSLVVLNGADSPGAKAFTLMHEVRHLLDRSGAVCNVWDSSSVERRCNQFAASLLMPADRFLRELGLDDPLANVGRLSRRFKVSREAAAIRLKELARISGDQLDAYLMDLRRQQETELSAESAEEDRSGPPHHRTHLRNLSPDFVGLVLDAYHEDRISLSDAATYLEAKVGTVRRMQEELVSRVELA